MRNTYKWMGLGVVSTGGADFDPTPIRIVMEPSERNQEDYRFTVKVVADDINEATQSFVLVLRLESAIRQESVDTAERNSTRCIIRDDDRTSFDAIIIVAWLDKPVCPVTS